MVAVSSYIRCKHFVFLENGDQLEALLTQFLSYHGIVFTRMGLARSDHSKILP